VIKINSLSQFVEKLCVFYYIIQNGIIKIKICADETVVREAWQ